MTQHILSTKWFPNPIQIYKNEKRKQVLYKELKTHTRVAVEVFKPKRPNHVQSMSCDMKHPLHYLQVQVDLTHSFQRLGVLLDGVDGLGEGDQLGGVLACRLTGISQLACTFIDECMNDLRANS